MENLYQECMVWRRLDARSAKRYTCLQNLKTGFYAVQSTDFFYYPVVDDGQLLRFAKQFLELLMEIDPLERCEWFDSLEDAIRAHEADFH